MEKEIEKFKKFINESKRIVFFGGAGVSTESGVPDFRSKDGLYNQHDIQFEKYNPGGLLHVRHHTDGEGVIQKFRIKVLLPRRRAVNYGGGGFVQPQLGGVGAGRIAQSLFQPGQKDGGDIPVHQTHLTGVAHRGTAHLGVIHDGQRHR